MRFILLKSDDLPMFTKELDLDEHVFYLRHQDGFRQMYKSQVMGVVVVVTGMCFLGCIIH